MHTAVSTAIGNSDPKSYQDKSNLYSFQGVLEFIMARPGPRALIEAELDRKDAAETPFLTAEHGRMLIEMDATFCRFGGAWICELPYLPDGPDRPHVFESGTGSGAVEAAYKAFEEYATAKEKAMSIIVDQVIELPAPPRGRKTTYEAGVCEAMTGSEFIAYAQYEAPNESFYIQRRGRTRKAALDELWGEVDLILFTTMPRNRKHLQRLIAEIEKERCRANDTPTIYPL
jgi:hypothetical protein